MTLASAVLLAVSCSPTAFDDRPELGRVGWSRDLPGAFAASEESGRPVLVLFQEVPG